MQNILKTTKQKQKKDNTLKIGKRPENSFQVKIENS